MRDSRMVLYQTEGGSTQPHVIIGEDTVWLTQAQMSELFQRDQSVVARHIKNVYAEHELDPASTMQKMGSSLFGVG